MEIEHKKDFYDIVKRKKKTNRICVMTQTYLILLWSSVQLNKIKKN